MASTKAGSFSSIGRRVLANGLGDVSPADSPSRRLEFHWPLARGVESSRVARYDWPFLGCVEEWYPGLVGHMVASDDSRGRIRAWSCAVQMAFRNREGQVVAEVHGHGYCCVRGVWSASPRHDTIAATRKQIDGKSDEALPGRLFLVTASWIRR